LLEERVVEALDSSESLVEIHSQHFLNQVEPGVRHVCPCNPWLISLLFLVTLIDLFFQVWAQTVRVITIWVQTAVVLVVLLRGDTWHSLIIGSTAHTKDKFKSLWVFVGLEEYLSSHDFSKNASCRPNIYSKVIVSEP